MLKTKQFTDVAYFYCWAVPAHAVMCLLGLLAWRRGAFVLLHIRDEILTRDVKLPSLGSRIIGGIDLLAGGTWMGVDVGSGRFAALTNVRRKLPSPASPTSRGELVSRYLQGELEVPTNQTRQTGAAAVPLGCVSLCSQGALELCASTCKYLMLAQRSVCRLQCDCGRCFQK